MATRILLAEDHGIVLQGLRSLIEKRPDMEVVGEAEDGQKAVELARQLSPDVVVMDVEMREDLMSGIEATRQIVHQFPEVKVIALSIHSQGPIIDGMLKAGASGYVLKEYAFDELVKGIQVVVGGDMYLSPRATSELVKKGKLLTDSLTDRERTVIQRKWKGENTKQIALNQGVSTKTIELDNRTIFTKLKVESWAEVFRTAQRENLISLER